jgi:hypothetical protein
MSLKEHGRKRHAVRNPGNILLKFGLAALALVVAVQPAWSQADLASLRGTVTDETGGIIPGALVTLTNTLTNDVRTTNTGPAGGYFFAAVVSGQYKVSVSIAGFQTVEQALQINPRESRGLDVQLTVGEQSEVVTVTAQTEIVQTETGAREGLLNAKQIDNLSIIGRSSMELLRIMPGVVAPEQRVLESTGFGQGANGTSNYTVNGVRGVNNTVSLDGSNLIDIGANNGVIISPNPDMVESVRIQTSNYAAEYGTSGVHVAATTKSGGNEFHGTVYTYLRHHTLAANDRSNAIAGVDKPESKFLYPGGNLSGPLIKDKLFFFGAFELQRQDTDQGTLFGVTPTLAMRQGDFSEFLNPVGENLLQPSVVVDPTTGQPAPNNNLAPWIDPMGQALMNQFPLPDLVTANNRFNYSGNELKPIDRAESILKLDYNISQNTKAYLRLAYSKERVEQPRGLWWDVGVYSLPTPVEGKNNGKSASFGVVSVINPTMTNEVLVSYSKLELNNDLQDPSVIGLDENGVGDFVGLFPRSVDWLPLQIAPWNDQGISNLGINGNPMFAHNSSLQVTDTLTKVMDTHVLKFGISVERADKIQNFQNNEQGQVEVASWGQPNATGSTLGNLLTGRPVVFAQGTVLPDGHFRQWNVAGFVQDSWKLRPNFTLEAGVRVGYMPNNQEINGLGAIFLPELYDPNEGAYIGGDITQLNGMAYASKGDVPNRLIPNRGLFWMPRLNFAWDLKGDGSTVVRGGAGVFYNRPQGNAEYDVIRLPPNGYQVRYEPWGEGSFNGLDQVDPYGLVGGQSISTNSPESLHFPRTTSLSLSVSRRLPGDQVLEVAYVGTFGRHLLNSRQTNVTPQGTFLQGEVNGVDLSVPANRIGLDASVTDSFRPYPSIGEVRYWEFVGTSNYHSLQATLSRQTSDRFQYFLTYTFSKSLGSTNVNETGSSLDPFDIRNRTYGVLPNDRTHVLNLSYNWMLPSPITESGNGFLKGLLNGWQLSGISTFSSGQPLRVKLSGAINQADTAWIGTPDGNDASNASGAIPPLVVGDPAGGGTAIGETLVRVDAFGIPTFPETGPYNSPVYIRTPNQHFHDITVLKNFALGGDKKLQFRMGFFNLFNMAFNSGTLENDIEGGVAGQTLQINTTCNVTVTVPNGIGGTTDVCDPTQGYSIDQNTLDNFGRINVLRGHRAIELAVKFYF